MTFTICLCLLLALLGLQLFFDRRKRQSDSKPKTDLTAKDLGPTAASRAAAEEWKSAFHSEALHLNTIANIAETTQNRPAPEASGSSGSGIQFDTRALVPAIVDQAARSNATASGARGTAAGAEKAPVLTQGEEARNTLLLDRSSINLGERFRYDILTPHVQQFESGMRRLLVGQDEAIDAFREVVQVAEAGLAMPGKPLGNFLFLGPTGSGKTKAMESVAEVMTGSELSLIRVDCAEFQHSHEIAKLIGSPPGYLGHRETKATIDNARLTELRKQSGTYDIAVIIFDEIEKASDALWNLLLGILDKATLTLGNNERVDFSRCIIGMTSNLGAKELVEAIQYGFVKPALTAKKKTDIGTGAARKKFSPEFFNRVDKVITFGTLGPAELKIIFGLEMLKVKDRINKVFPFLRLFYTESLEAFLVAEGFDQRYGARPLKRAIHRHLVMPLSNVLGSGQIPQRRVDVLIDYNETEGGVSFSPIIL